MAKEIVQVDVFKTIGIVQKKRKFENEKKTWCSHTVTVSTAGMTVEVQITENQFAVLHDGMVIEVQGKFELANGATRRIASRVMVLSDTSIDPVEEVFGKVGEDQISY